MNKSLLLLILSVSLLASKAFAQNAFYDALYLAQNEKNIALLNQYKNVVYFTPQELQQVNLVTNFIKKPFSLYQHKLNVAVLKVVMKKLATSSKAERPQTVDGSLPVIGSLIPSSFKKFSNFSGTKNADFYQGISKYIAAEFKKGVTLSFFNAFEKSLSKIGELQILFPTTYQALKNRDPFRFPALGTQWKEVFHQDLQNIVKNFVQYVETPHSEAASKALFLTSDFAFKLQKNPQYQHLKLGDDIASKLINKFHPVDLMNYLDMKYFQNPDGNHQKVGTLLHKLNVLQTNLRDTTGNTWINFEQFNRLGAAQMGIFVGLLYQTSPQVFADMKAKVSVNNEAHPTKCKRYLLNNILPVYEELIQIQEFEKSKGKSLYDQEYGNYMQHFANLLQTADRKLMTHSVLNPAAPDGKGLTANGVAGSESILQKTLDVYKSIHQKEYNNLIPNLSKILLQMLNQSEQNTSYAKMLSKLDRYGSFMIGVVNAKDVNQMRDLIGRVIATSSSYLKKRTALRTMSVTCPCGLLCQWRIVRKNRYLGTQYRAYHPIRVRVHHWVYLKP
ncbi:hypothetical protein [Microscilla marina]|uniref:Uncharacterized protein n=1 Tax=Microscilla marina ATCC 23134 TaxID=313606 RepID=A1ZL53_MICM2|nr:hypothetical protein [Microscilla marina]EAY29019.1 hypothetical protein M23134_00173 [Microscilla marina ATCC 23134]